MENALLELIQKYTPLDHLRPIDVYSETFEFEVIEVVPAILWKIDPNQFKPIPKSRTIQAFISMVHNLVEATDGRVSAIRVALLDFRKTFDLIDHRILTGMVFFMNILSDVVAR